MTVLQEKGVHDYYVKLDRVWFWPGLIALGLHPQNGLQADANMSLEVLSLAQPSEILF